MSEPILSIRHGAKRYGARTVLQIERFDLQKGERIQLMGANGAGKSTFLRIVAGITPMSEGFVRRSMHEAGLSIGFVPQQRGLSEDLTLRENALLISSGLRADAPTLENNPDLIAEFGLGRYMDRVASEMSDGMKRLSVVLCVLAARPDVFIADEPLSGVDAHNRNAVLSHILAGGAERTTLISTHAELSGLRRIHIDLGRLQA